MTKSVVLLRNPTNGRILFLSEDDPDEMRVFISAPDAEAEAYRHPLCQAWPYQIVELDELDF